MGLSKQMSKLLLSLSIFGFLMSTAMAQRVIVSSAIKHDVSPAVRDLPVIARSEHENRAHQVKHWPHKPVVSSVDPVVQSSATLAVATSNVTGSSFDESMSVNSSRPKQSRARSTRVVRRHIPHSPS